MDLLEERINTSGRLDYSHELVQNIRLGGGRRLELVHGCRVEAVEVQPVKDVQHLGPTAKIMMMIKFFISMKCCIKIRSQSIHYTNKWYL
jgi:hypothetical protein